MSKETLEYDNIIRQQYPTIVGCDEVGRGCLAGPVITAAVILPPNTDLPEVGDSKKIKKADHAKLARLIYDVALEVRIGVRTAEEIDESNILEADKDAMRDTINELTITPDIVLIDGDNKQLLGTAYTEQTVVKGDNTSLTIGAASIVAKYMRDRLMQEYHHQYPEYGFDTNAGYGTVKHKSALERYGITPIHRKTFEPIKSHIGVWKQYGGATNE